MSDMKYLDPAFSSPTNSKAYRDNYDEVFRPSTYCVYCKETRKVGLTGEVDGSREKAICRTCKGTIWLHTGGSYN